MSAYFFRYELKAALLEELVGRAWKVFGEMRSEVFEASSAKIVPYRLVNELDFRLNASGRFGETFC
jgi:hypothetical protein